jgi:hypothetical protein
MNKLLLLTILLITSTLKAQEKAGDYDLELYQKRLTVIPKLDFGIFADRGYFNLGGEGYYVVQKNILAHAVLGVGNTSNLELGGILALQNRIVTRSKYIYNRDLGGNQVELLKARVNYHKLKGIRGGLYRKGMRGISSGDMTKLGYGETTIDTELQGSKYVDTLRKDSPIFGPSRYSFNYSSLGAYGGIYFYSSSNFTNANHETGMSAKGYKNQYLAWGFDLLFGGTTLTLNNNSLQQGSIKDRNKKTSSPVGGRFVFEAGLYFGKKQNVGLHFNAEMGNYPGGVGLAAIAGLGIKINLLDKVLSN